MKKINGDRMRTGIQTIMLVLAVPLGGMAQDLVWSANYGGTYNDGGYASINLPDSGYAAVGTTFSFGAGDFDAYLLRLDSLGNILWTKTLGGTLSDAGHDLQLMPDGGYLIVGTTSSSGAGGSDLCLWRTDSLGNLLWSKTYGGAQNDEGWSIRSTYGLGFIVCGTTSSSGAGYADLWLLKIDTSGAVVWSRTFGGAGGETGAAVRQTRDSGIIAVGATGSFGQGYSSMYAVRVSSTGDSLWATTYGGSRADCAYSVEVLPDDGLIICGMTASFGAGYYDAYLVRTDGDGNQVWDHAYGGARDDYGYSICLTGDGFLLVGTTESSGAGASDVYAVKVDPLGEPVWTRTYGGSKGDYCRAALRNRVSQYVVIGSSFSFAVGGSDLYLAVLAGDGQTPVDDDFRGLPEGFALDQNYPNPFNAGTQISFSVGYRTSARLAIYNVLGQRVREWNLPSVTAGSYSVEWDGTDEAAHPVSSGVYFYRIEAGPMTLARKMVFVK